MKNLLIDAVNGASRTFRDGELAFLALTSKVERPFLDRVAYALHQKLEPDSIHVAREFPIPRAGRADVAILQENRLRGVLEGKAMLVADCTRAEPKRGEYAQALQRDIDRYRDAAVRGAEIYSLLLGVHPLERIPIELRSVVKYMGALNSAYTRLHTADRICQESDFNLRGYIRNGVVVDSGTIGAGTAFGVPVEIRWWCFGPFSSPEHLRLLRQDTA